MADWVRYIVADGDGGLWIIQHRFGFLDGQGRIRGTPTGWMDVWTDSRNAPLRAAGRQPGTLRAGDELWLLEPAPDPAARLATYVCDGTESSLQQICDKINRQYASSSDETPVDGPVTPGRLYFLFENWTFRGTHPAGADLRVQKFTAGDALQYWVKKKRVAQVAVETKPENAPAAAPTNAVAVPGALDDDRLAEAALVASGNMFRFALAPQVDFLRRTYNAGAARIADFAASQKALGISEELVAREVAGMRHELAMKVRKEGGTVWRMGAELFDKARGRARPDYQALRAAGKTDAEIILSASKTNSFINKLPGRLKWTGRAFWIIDIAVSIGLVLTADPQDQQRVLREEINTGLGGAAGGAAGGGLCVAAGMASEGIGYGICVFVGSMAGSWGANKVDLMTLLDIAPHAAPEYAGKTYYVAGPLKELDFFIFSVEQDVVTRADGILVVATGMISGEKIGGRGHYRDLEVVPVSDRANSSFELQQTGTVWVRQYLLFETDGSDFANQT